MITIQYNEASIYTLGKLRLIPGENQVDPELYKAAKEHQGFKHRVKHGVIVVSEPDDSEEKKSTKRKAIKSEKEDFAPESIALKTEHNPDSKEDDKAEGKPE